METVLYGLNQMVMVQGTLPRPWALKPKEPMGTEVAAMAAWDLRAGRAYIEISLRIEDEWKQLIMGSRDPVKAWMEGAGGDVQSEYGWHASSLIHANNNYEVHGWNSYFLNSLPLELDQFSTTVNHTTETIASVTMRLRQIELCQELCSKGGIGLLVKSKGKGGGMKTRRGKCNNFSEAGHQVHDCTKLKKRNNANGSAQGSTQPVGHMFTAVNKQAAGYEGTTMYYLDSGASNHYTPCQEDLQDYIPFSTPYMINMAKGQVQAIGAGTVRYAIQLKDGTKAFGKLQDMTQVPGISARLLSMFRLAGSGYTAAFKQTGSELRGPGGNMIDIPVVQQVYPVQL